MPEPASSGLSPTTANTLRASFDSASSRRLRADRRKSLAAYAEAERLYKAASRQEGETEVLIRRGALLDTLGEFRDARAALERALALARSIESPFHVVRAQMFLSSVTASEGRLAEAEQMASDAVKTALDAGLETVAADGLIDLAATLMYASSRLKPNRSCNSARELAEKRDAKRTLARASLQLASLQLDNGQPAAALKTLQPPLDFFKQRRFRRYELTALSIASRANERLDDIPRAHVLAGTRGSDRRRVHEERRRSRSRRWATLPLRPRRWAHFPRLSRFGSGPRSCIGARTTGRRCPTT